MTEYEIHPGISWIGLYANRPSAGRFGRICYTTDTGAMYYDDGALWVKMGGALPATIFTGHITPSSTSYQLGTSTDKWGYLQLLYSARIGSLWINGNTAGKETVIDTDGTIENITGCFPQATGTYGCGSSGLKWADMWTVADHVGDTIFDNNMRITEAEKLGMGKGLAFLSKKGKVLMVLDGEGNMKIRGKISRLEDEDE